MSRRLAPLLTVVLALAVAACSSVDRSRYLHGQEIATEGESLGHAHGETWGLYLFMLPVATGSSLTPGETVFGRNTVTAGSAVALVTDEAARLGATRTLDLTSSTSTFWIWPIVQIKSAEASGNAVR